MRSLGFLLSGELNSLATFVSCNAIESMLYFLVNPVGCTFLIQIDINNQKFFLDSFFSLSMLHELWLHAVSSCFQTCLIKLVKMLRLGTNRLCTFIPFILLWNLASILEATISSSSNIYAARNFIVIGFVLNSNYYLVLFTFIFDFFSFTILVICIVIYKWFFLNSDIRTRIQWPWMHFRIVIHCTHLRVEQLWVKVLHEI